MNISAPKHWIFKWDDVFIFVCATILTRRSIKAVLCPASSCCFLLINFFINPNQSTSILHFKNCKLLWLIWYVAWWWLHWFWNARACVLVHRNVRLKWHIYAWACWHVWVSACLRAVMLFIAWYPQAFCTHTHIWRCAFVTHGLGVKMSPFPKD